MQQIQTPKEFWSLEYLDRLPLIQANIVRYVKGQKDAEKWLNARGMGIKRLNAKIVFIIDNDGETMLTFDCINGKWYAGYRYQNTFKMSTI